jgi:DNA-binding beta-propeller fold protein YncE
MDFKTNSFLFRYLLIFFTLFFIFGCMKDDQWVREHFLRENNQLSTGGVFVINEGNFMYGNATLSFYDSVKRIVQNDLFYRVNGLPLGDVAQSMTVWQSTGFIVINNSGKVYNFDLANGKYIGKITGLTSPRYIHFANDQKAYITDLYAGKIAIVNPKERSIVGYIPCPKHPSTEEMVQLGNLLFVSCWSGDKCVLVVNMDKDLIVTEISTGNQPCGLVADRYGKIWVLCQALPGNSSGNQAVLQRIDPINLKIDQSFNFDPSLKPIKLKIDAKGDNLYYLLGNQVVKMSVLANHLPDIPFLTINSKLLYGLGIDPVNGNIYVSDAIDYQQPGSISRFSQNGTLIDNFKAGIIPGGFSFK